MALTTTADIEELLPIIYEKARKTILETPVMRNLVTTFDIRSKAGNSIKLPKWGMVTAHSLTEGVDMDNLQTLGTTGIDLTVSEAGAQTGVTDDEIEDASEDVMKRHGEILGEAIADKDDKDALALFSGLSVGLGGAGVALALPLFTAAMTRLRGAKVKASDQMLFVTHPYSYHGLAQALLADSNYGALRPIVDDEIAKRFRAKELLGVNIYETANIDVDENGDAVSAMFVKDAFARVDKRPLRIEKERNASLRAWELNATTRYKYAEVEDTHGVKVTTDATAPTGA